MNILVVGESCEDAFIYGNVDRVCPEAPAPLLDLSPLSTVTSDEVRSRGMAANVVANLKAIAEKEDEPLSSTFLTEEVGTKTRFVDKNSNQMLLRVDVGRFFKPLGKAINDFDFSNYDAVIVSDYNKGFLTDDDLLAIARGSKLSFLDTKRLYSKSWAEKFSFVKINEKEAKQNGFYEHWQDAKKNTIVTKGAKGCFFQDRDYAIEHPLAVRDVCGAGDTFLAAFSFKYIQGHNTDVAIDYALACCSQVVSKKGICTI